MINWIGAAAPRRLVLTGGRKAARPAPADLRELRVSDGAVIELARGAVYSGPLTIIGADDVVLRAAGEGPNPIIDVASGRGEAAIQLVRCRRVVIDGIDSRGGRYGRVLNDCGQCEMRNFDQTGATLHAIWLKGSQTQRCTIEDFDSHDNGTANYKADSRTHINPDGRQNIGHGILTSGGANQNLFRRFRSYRNAEDGIQQGRDDGGGNQFRDFVLFDNLEDGIDVKGGDARYENGVIRGNRRNGVNLHARRRAEAAFRNLHIHPDNGISSLEVKNHSFVTSLGGNVVEGDEAPAIKIRHEQPYPSHFRRDRILNGGRGGRPCTVYVEAGLGHVFEECEVRRDAPGACFWLTGEADELRLIDVAMRTPDGEPIRRDPGKIVHLS